MYLAIIADSHDNLANLEKCLTWFRQNEIAKIICLGDLTTSETLSFLAANFRGEIFLVQGNGEIYDSSELSAFPQISFHNHVGIISLDGLKIGFVHEKRRLKKLLEKSPEKFAFLFYGHSHQPWLEKDESTIIANPGNLAGTFHQATFATLETADRRLELKILANL